MKKILAITLTLALLLSIGLVSPVLATTVPTDVNVSPGEGQAPIIKVKWETPDHDLTKAGTQINPPLAYGAVQPVQFWAIVTHPAGKDNVAAVYVDVWHPDTMPECGSHKYQLRLEKVDKFGEGKPAFIAAWENGTITDDCLGINPETNEKFTYDEIIVQLDQCTSDVYMVEGELCYCQPAGMYRVQIKAVPNFGPNAYLTNLMEYVAVSAIEVDFSSISYGTVTPCVWKQIDGDKVWGSSKATVRNIGNTDSKITVHQTDLKDADGNPLGKTGGEWNVEYGARLGSALDGYDRQEYVPCQTITLDKVLPLCNTDKLDLWIHIAKLGTSGTWTGEITVGSVVEPFESCTA